MYLSETVKYLIRFEAERAVTLTGPESRIFVAGHRGLVGSAIVRALERAGHRQIIVRTRAELELTDQRAVREFFASTPIDLVFVAAGKVGGIVFNRDFQADFLYENLMIGTNVIEAAARSGVRKLLYLGSSCIYPRLAAQPMREDSFLTGPLEPTNEGYAIAKIACVKLCEKYRLQYGRSFISAIPTGLYGEYDNFHPDHSHVIPGLMRRFHEAKLRGDSEVVIWGTGEPVREFLHVDDVAEALLLLMHSHEGGDPINIGTGEGTSIRSIAEAIRGVVGYTGRIVFDPSKPDGMPRKALNGDRMRALGWAPRCSLQEGLERTYRWAVERGVFEAKVGSRAGQGMGSG